MTTLTVTVRAGQALSCFSCGTNFWVTEDFERQHRESHQNFFCPNGHSQYWPHESEAETAKRQLKYAKERLASVEARLDQTEHSRRAWKAQATKLRNRAGAGECPLCGKSIYHLDRHMSRVHADTRHAEPSENEQM